MELLQSYVDGVILRALEEDITGLDVTSDFLLDEAHESDAYLMAKAEGVVCGLEIAARVFGLVGSGVTFTARFRDGDRVKYGDILAVMHGPTRTLLIPTASSWHRTNPAIPSAPTSTRITRGEGTPCPRTCASRCPYS